MSMPHYFVVAVVAYNDQSAAATAAALLGGPGNQGIAPHIAPVCVLPRALNSLTFIEAGHRQGLVIAQCVDLFLVDARRVDLWLCLDDKAEDSVRRHIRLNGPAPKGFYRSEFPDPVMRCQSVIPPLPETADLYEMWLETLRRLCTPWQRRIMQAFGNSS